MEIYIVREGGKRDGEKRERERERERERGGGGGGEGGSILLLDQNGLLIHLRG